MLVLEYLGSQNHHDSGDSPRFSRTCQYPPDDYQRVRKPMQRGGGGSGVMSSRMASNTTLNWLSYFFSSSSRRLANSLLEAISSRNRTKARTIWTLMSTASGLFSTIAAMMALCSVKAYGKVLLPPRPGFDLANCEVKALTS